MGLKMAEAVDYKQIGTSPVRPDGFDKVTGRAQFGADVNLPNMIHGKVLRSPHAHARIKSVDVSAALAMPGVHAAISAVDFPGGRMEGESDVSVDDVAQNVMARNKGAVSRPCCRRSSCFYPAFGRPSPASYQRSITRFLSRCWTWLLRWIQQRPLVNDNNYTALAEKPEHPSNIADVERLERGNLEEGFLAADVVIEREYKCPMAHQGYIEPHACLASIDERGRGTVWCSTQGHFQHRASTASMLGKNMADLKFVATEIGGGFGGKTVVYLEPLATLLSEKSGRPVKMAMSREEVFRATGPSSATVARVKVGLRKDGTITAAQSWIAFEAGAFAGSPHKPGAMCIYAPYDIENFLVETFDVLVNKPKVAAYRAPGAPQAMHAFECALDEAAQLLDMDPLDLRLVNAAEEGTRAPYGPKFPPIGF
jgi:CO/xanthine dehydrogenase Mo-binding subunit